MVRSCLLILSMWMATTAWAGKTEVSEEALRAAIETEVARNAWAEADRAYVLLIDAGIRLDAREHLLAGQAARAMGRVNDALTRFELSARLEQTPEAEEEIARITQEYGQVDLKIPGGWEGAVPLKARTPLVDPLLRLQLEEARKVLAAEGRYRGLLPLGGYRLGETAFEVTREEPVKVKLK